MPPKKRKPSLDFKSSPSMQFLVEHYSKLPTCVNELRNGHVFYVHTSDDNIGLSVTKTTRALSVKYEIPFISGPILRGSLSYQIKRIVNKTLTKYKSRNRDQKEIDQFTEICMEKFTWVTEPDVESNTNNSESECDQSMFSNLDSVTDPIASVEVPKERRSRKTPRFLADYACSSLTNDKPPDTSPDTDSHPTLTTYFQVMRLVCNDGDIQILASSTDKKCRKKLRSLSSNNLDTEFDVYTCVSDFIEFLNSRCDDYDDGSVDGQGTFDVSDNVSDNLSDNDENTQQLLETESCGNVDDKRAVNNSLEYEGTVKKSQKNQDSFNGKGHDLDESVEIIHSENTENCKIDQVKLKSDDICYEYEVIYDNSTTDNGAVVSTDNISIPRNTCIEHIEIIKIPEITENTDHRLKISNENNVILEVFENYENAKCGDIIPRITNERTDKSDNTTPPVSKTLIPRVRKVRKKTIKTKSMNKILRKCKKQNNITKVTKSTKRRWKKKMVDDINQCDIPSISEVCNTPYKCTTCKMVFSRRITIEDHQLVSHCDVPLTLYDYECAICGKMFAKACNIHQHLHTHARVKLYRCEGHCDKSFTTKYQLRDHILGYSGVNKYKCDVCGKAWATKGGLTGHMISHTQERRHQCNTCGKTYSRITDLRQHLFTHDDRKFSCAVCQKLFMRSKDLRLHTEIHDRERKRPFVCSVCSRGFTRKTHCVAHEKRHTKREETYNTGVVKSSQTQYYYLV